MTTPMPDAREILVWVIAVPVGIALLATALSHWPLTRDRATQPWGPALAIAAGFAAAFAGLRGRPAFPPRDAQTWLVYLAAISVLIAILATVLGTKRWTWFILAPLSLALLLATVWLLARSQIPLFGWKRFLLRAAVIAAGMIIWFALMELLSARPKGGAAAALPLILTIVASVAA